MEVDNIQNKAKTSSIPVRNDDEKPITVPPPVQIEAPETKSDDINIQVEADIQTQPEPQPTPQPEPKPLPETPPPTLYPQKIENAPLKQPSNPKKSVAIISSISAIFIIVGFVGGYFAYKYWPNLLGGITTSADSITSESLTINPSSKSDIPGAVSTWPVYLNTLYKYSLKYPDTWFSLHTDDPVATIVTVSSTNPDQTTTTGEKVTITTQLPNSKTLKDWVSSNNTISKITPTEQKNIIVGGRDAIQQTVALSPKTIDTYILTTDNIIVITYSASGDLFTEGKLLYDQILQSVIFI